MNLKTCPYSPEHKVYGGYPEYVCPSCGTDWVVVGNHVLYNHFNSDGIVVKKWKVPLEGEGKIRRRH